MTQILAHLNPTDLNPMTRPLLTQPILSAHSFINSDYIDLFKIWPTPVWHPYLHSIFPSHKISSTIYLQFKLATSFKKKIENQPNIIRMILNFDGPKINKGLYYMGKKGSIILLKEPTKGKLTWLNKELGSPKLTSLQVVFFIKKQKLVMVMNKEVIKDNDLPVKVKQSLSTCGCLIYSLKASLLANAIISIKFGSWIGHPKLARH